MSQAHVPTAVALVKIEAKLRDELDQAQRHLDSTKMKLFEARVEMYKLLGLDYNPHAHPDLIVRDLLVIIGQDRITND